METPSRQGLSPRAPSSARAPSSGGDALFRQRLTPDIDEVIRQRKSELQKLKERKRRGKDGRKYTRSSTMVRAIRLVTRQSSNGAARHEEGGLRGPGPGAAQRMALTRWRGSRRPCDISALKPREPHPPTCRAPPRTPGMPPSPPPLR